MTHSVTYCCVGGRGAAGRVGGRNRRGPHTPSISTPARYKGGPWRAARGALIFIASLLRKAPKIKIKNSDPDPSGKEYPPISPHFPHISTIWGFSAIHPLLRSEERRVGKECRSW